MKMELVCTDDRWFDTFYTHISNYRIPSTTVRGHHYSAVHFQAMDLGQQGSKIKSPHVIFPEALVVTGNLGITPALGGIRLISNPQNLESILEKDVPLAEAMVDKAIMADKKNDGCKWVLITGTKSPAHLRWLGCCVKWHKGTVTACDWGITDEDLLYIGETGAPHVAALPVEKGGSGNTATPTAYSVMRTMLASSYIETGTMSLQNTKIVLPGAPLFSDF
jgi:glutamate dehydrogenase/leucine dehydrogenase